MKDSEHVDRGWTAPFPHQWHALVLFASFWLSLYSVGMALVFNWPAFGLVGILCVAVVVPSGSWLFFLIVEAISPIRLGPEELRTYDGFGRKAIVPYESISRVTLIWFWPGLKFAWLDVGKGLLLNPCLALFLREQERFCRELADRVTGDHPLREFLRWQRLC